uniref:Large ribosomal subunit protein P2 n=1 Tax=Oncorhynchus mykiss TaxID=8022 RepID=A0A8C7SNT6_ONCMY
MRYVAAYLLAVLGGNTSPSSKDIKTILGSVGIEAEAQRLDKASLSWPPCQQVVLWQLLQLALWLALLLLLVRSISHVSPFVSHHIPQYGAKHFNGLKHISLKIIALNNIIRGKCSCFILDTVIAFLEMNYAFCG